MYTQKRRKNILYYCTSRDVKSHKVHGVYGNAFQNASDSIRKHNQKLIRDKYLDEASVRLDSFSFSSSEVNTHDKSDEKPNKYDSPEIIKRLLKSACGNKSNSNSKEAQISIERFNVSFTFFIEKWTNRIIFILKIFTYIIKLQSSKL